MEVNNLIFTLRSSSLWAFCKNSSSNASCFAGVGLAWVVYSRSCPLAEKHGCCKGQTKLMLSFAAILIMSGLMWDEWPSRSKRSGLFLVCTNSRKSLSNHIWSSSLFIHPLPLLYMVPDTFPIVRLDRDTHVSYASRCWDTHVLDSCWCDSLLSLLVIKRNTIPGSSQLMWLWIAFQPIAPQCLLQKIVMLVYGTLVDVPCTRQSFGISQNYLWMPVLKALTPATRHLYSIMPLAGHWLCNGIYSISCPATPKLCTFH